MWQNSNWDKTQKVKLGQNSKTPIVTNLKNSNCDKTWIMTNLNFQEEEEKTWKGSFSRSILTPWQPMRWSLGSNLRFSNWDQTQKLKLWWNAKTQILWNSKTQTVMKLKNSNCDESQKLKLLWNSHCDETQFLFYKTQNLQLWQNLKTQIVTKLKLWQNSKTQIVTNLKNSNCDKTWIMTNLNLWEEEEKTLRGSFSRNIFTPWQTIRYSLGSVFRFSNWDQNQKFKLWWNSKQNFFETEKLKLLWNSKTQIVMNLKSSNCDETQIVMKVKNSNGDLYSTVQYSRSPVTYTAQYSCLSPVQYRTVQ